MAVVTLPEVQAWLAATKYTVAVLDSNLEETARQMVFGRLASADYDTSAWTTTANTPELVRRLIAMLVAAWEYDKATAEDQLEGSTYSDKLERRVWGMVESILTADLEIEGVEPDPTLSQGQSIAFFPTDLEDEDVDHARVFTMGKVW